MELLAVNNEINDCWVCLSLPVNSGKHVVTDGEELHDSFIKMKIFKSLKQVGVPKKDKKQRKMAFNNICTEYCHLQL